MSSSLQHLFCLFSVLIFAPINLNSSNEYIGVSLAFTFAQAEDYCQQYYKTHLASLYNNNDAIKAETACAGVYALGDKGYQYYSVTYTNCWIGLDGRDTSSGDSIYLYEWTDGTGTPSPSYTLNTDTITGGGCARMRSSTGVIYDSACTYLYGFLCNAPKYVAVETPMNKTGAELYCYSTYNTSLASSHSETEDHEMYELAQYIHSLGDQGSTQFDSGNIALFLGFETSSYSYTDASLYDYTSTFGMYTMTGSECGVVYSSDGQWDDLPCTYEQPFLCNAPRYLGQHLAVGRATSQASCTSLFGTDLASIHSAKDNEMVRHQCEVIKDLGQITDYTLWPPLRCWFGLFGTSGTDISTFGYPDGTDNDYNFTNVSMGSGGFMEMWDTNSKCYEVPDTYLFASVCNMYPQYSEDTYNPTTNPTNAPSDNLTVFQTVDPTTEPTVHPTVHPTTDPAIFPTTNPTVHPTIYPTTDPTIDLENPSNTPTTDPSNRPTKNPTSTPTIHTTNEPPTKHPTVIPTINPTIQPTNNPAIDPTNIATEIPTKDGSVSSGSNENNSKVSAITIIISVVLSLVFFISFIISYYFYWKYKQLKANNEQMKSLETVGNDGILDTRKSTEGQIEIIDNEFSDEGLRGHTLGEISQQIEETPYV